MQIIKLTHGAGNGVDAACLMTASNMLIGRGKDGDDNSCVCEILRNFIIPINDSMPLDLLTEHFGPLTWEILGTRTDDEDVKQQRMYAFADWSVREMAPLWLESYGDKANADKLRALSPVVDKETARLAVYVANAANPAVPWSIRAPMCAAIIRRVAAIGPKRSIECVLTLDQLSERLNKCAV
jgi:hypothetical protein